MITVSVRKVGPGAYCGRVSVEGRAQHRTVIVSKSARARALAVEIAAVLRKSAAWQGAA